MDQTISADGIREAANVIDPVFLRTPQYECEPLSKRLGVTTLLKVESANPIRSFKGRGADYLMHVLADDARRIVCASAGNFGQGMAYACRKRNKPITVFAARSANPLKVERMKALGAHVELIGDDFDQAKDAAKLHAQENGQLYIEDGKLAPIAEGAGTIAIELTDDTEHLDAIFVPLGPTTRVIAVCAQNAPSMALSFEAKKAVTAPSSTIADGIAVRVPVPEAVGAMANTVDEVMLVTDDEMLQSMRDLLDDAGLIVEPAGAAGVAAIQKRAQELANKRVAAILTGGNLTAQQIADWLTGAPGRRGGRARPGDPAR